MISLKQIKYALAVGRTLHFRRAADECNISQSALSTALQDMEQQLGFAVFERDNKKVLITPLGQEVLDKAGNIQVQIEDIMRLGQTHGKVLGGPLSMGMIPTIAPYLLPSLLPGLSQQYPDLQLSVAEQQSHVLVDKVRRGELDCAVLALPYNCEGLLTFNFWKENFYWVGHRDMAPSRQPVMHADELADHQLMLLSEGHCLKDHALAACKMDSQATHSLSATSMTTLIQLVIGKMGSTLVPEIALEQLVDIHPCLVKLPLDEPGPHRELAFLIRPNYANTKNIEALISIASKQLTNTMKIDKPAC